MDPYPIIIDGPAISTMIQSVGDVWRRSAQITFDSRRVGEAAGHLHTHTRALGRLHVSAVAPITQQIGPWRSLYERTVDSLV